MPSTSAAILLLIFCSSARAVPACVRGTTAAATTLSEPNASIIYAQLPTSASGTDQESSLMLNSGKSNSILAATLESHSWSSSYSGGSGSVSNTATPTRVTFTEQALTSAHLAENSSSSKLPATSAKVATLATQVSNVTVTTTGQLMSTKAKVVSSSTGSSAVSATKTGSSFSKMGISWPVQEKDASPIAQFFTSTSVSRLCCQSSLRY